MKKQLQAVIVVHHLGYREFRGPAIAGAVLTCGILSLAYLLTMSPLAAVGGHIIAHSGAILLGRELPPPQEKRACSPLAAFRSSSSALHRSSNWGDGLQEEAPFEMNTIRWPFCKRL